MKFMKLGSKPDSFQTDGNDVRIVATELASDIIVHVGDVNFHLHKFPLLSKSARMQKLVSAAASSAGNEESAAEIHLSDIPGGPTAFETCAKFCYGMTVTLNPHNVISVRCAAEFLEMQESLEKGNLIYKIDVFLSTSVFRSWKDSIIALQTMKSLKPWTEDLKLVTHCMDSIASKASADVSKVDWSYTYNRKKLVPSVVPKDWWVDDLTELELDHFKQIVTAVKTKGRVSSQVIGEGVRAYTYKRVPSLSRVSMVNGDAKVQLLIETVIWLVPSEKGSVSCSFLLKLLRAASLLNCEDACKKELVKRIGRQLDEASVNDLLIPATDGELTIYDIDVVLNIVEEFVMQDNNGNNNDKDVRKLDDNEVKGNGVISCSSKVVVGKLVDGFLAEVAKDPNMPLSKFLDLAEMVSGDSRLVHDDLYRAVDIYLKEHPSLSKGEKKKLCALLDCKRLSADACAHAVQNERLPLRLVVQVLFYEQARASANSSASASTSASVSYGSSRSAATTNTIEDEWDGVSVPTVVVEDLNSLKSPSNCGNKGAVNGVVNGTKVKGMGIMTPKKILGKIMSSGKAGPAGGDSSSSDTSGSPGSANQEEAPPKSTPGRNAIRYSVS